MLVEPHRLKSYPSIVQVALSVDETMVELTVIVTEPCFCLRGILRTCLSASAQNFNRDSPDESQTGINVRICPGPLTRQTRGADRYQRSGNPNAWSSV